MKKQLPVQMNIFEAEAALFLKTCREIAREVCKQFGDVTADDVRVRFQSMHPEVPWNNAAGKIFRSPEFEPTGGIRKSVIRKRKGGLNRIWRLKIES